MRTPADGHAKGHLRPLLYRRAWLAVWALGWLLCIVLSLIAPPTLPETPPMADKLGHLLAYAVLAAWAVQLFATRRALVLSLIALVALGVVLEFAQGALTTTRLADPRDALANSLGVLLGSALVWTPARNALLLLEGRIHRAQ